MQSQISNVSFPKNKIKVSQRLKNEILLSSETSAQYPNLMGPTGSRNCHQNQVFLLQKNTLSNRPTSLPSMDNMNQKNMTTRQPSPNPFHPRASTPSIPRSRFNVSAAPRSTSVSGTSLQRAPGLVPHSLPTVASIVNNLLLPPEKTKQQQPRSLNFNYVNQLEKSALVTISKLWADTTIENRRNTWGRFLEFTRKHKFPIQQQQQMDWAIVMFCEHLKRLNPKLLPSSQLTYGKTLAAVASRLTMVVPITRMYLSGLRASGALIPQEQAPALPFRPHLARLAEESLKLQLRNASPEQKLPERLHTLLFLMVKTCSRFDEVQRLTRKQLKVLNENEILIDWEDKTKSTRMDPNREDTKVILRHPPGIPTTVNLILDQWNWPTLLPYNVTWFSNWMNEALGDLQSKNANLEPLAPTSRTKGNYTAHSIKAMVVTYLTRQWKEGNVQGSTVSLMAKHSLQESSRMEGVSRQTLRYVRDPELIARANGSPEATALIPWPEPRPLRL